MVPKKKKHHYIPQFYLGGFTNEDGRLFVLDHEGQNINKQSKEGTFHKYKYYTVNFSKHKKRDPKQVQRMRVVLEIDHIDISNIPEDPDMVENLLMDSENISAPIIRKIIKGEQVNNLEKAELSTFIALMYTRNPLFLEFSLDVEKWLYEKQLTKTFSSKQKVQEVYQKMKQNGYQKEFDLDEMFRFINEKKYSVEIPKESGIQAMLISTTIIDKILFAKTWIILETPKDSSFITNDNPVFLEHPDIYEKGIFGVGFETPGVRVIFPLSKECFLIIADTAHNGVIFYKKIDKKAVRKINERIFERSRNYVMAKDEVLIKRIKKSFN